MKKNASLKSRLCFRRACTFLLILMSVQVSAKVAETGGQRQIESIQQKNITGKVTDNTGKPVPGATVIVKGTTSGSITDENGQYTLNNVSSNSVLVFSFVGMKTVEAKAGNQSTIDAVLVDESIGLDEVVAVGYGTQKKASITGSVASIRNEELVRTKSENVVNMLTGKLPGVRVVQKSSAPGAYDSTIDIRGMGAPLFVIDGITRDQAYFARMDPQEIESISVLKDGSAAIYGLRAANGVILMQDGVIQHLDEPAILHQCQEMSLALAERCGSDSKVKRSWKGNRS